MKKVIAIVISVIMLVSLCGISSSAFTVKLPTVTGVKLLDDEPVSMKYLDNYKAMMDETMEDMLEETGLSKEEFIEEYETIFGDLFEDVFYTFDVSNLFELTLSDGSVIELDADDMVYEIDGYTDVNMNAVVKYKDYLAAKEEDADTINVTVECEVFSYISGITKESEFTVEVDLVDCFLKDFAPVSTINYSLYEDSDELDLEGKKFRVTYADGTAKTLTAKYDAAEESFMLGGEYITTWFDDDAVTIEYMDELYKHSATFDKENPYESIEITDYELSETEGLTSVTYEITDKKGKSKSFTADMTPYLEEGQLYPSYWCFVDVFDTYYVSISCDKKLDYEGYEVRVSAVELYASIGELYGESVEIEYYEIEEEMDILAKIEEIIASILSAFFDILSFFQA